MPKRDVVKIKLDPQEADGLASLLEDQHRDHGFRDLASDIRHQLLIIDLKRDELLREQSRELGQSLPNQAST